MKTITTHEELTRPEYRILFNSITDSVTMLIFIRQSWKAHPFLQKELSEVIGTLNSAQAHAEDVVLAEAVRVTE